MIGSLPSSSSSTPFNMNAHIDPNNGSIIDNCIVAISIIAWQTAFRTRAEGSAERADKP